MITLDRKEIKTKFSKIQGLVGKNSGLAITSNALLEINGKCSIKATDLTTGLKQKINVSSDENLAICIDKKVCEIVKEIEGAAITLELEENDKHILMTAGKSRFKIPCHPADDFPSWPTDVEGVAITLNADETKEVANRLKKAIVFTDRNKHDAKNCILLEVAADNIRFVGTDGFRLAVIDKKLATGVSEDRRYLIPESSASEIINFLSNATQEAVIVLSEKYITVEADGDELYIRPLESQIYPAYTKALCDYSNHSKMFAEKDVLAKALRRVSAINQGTKVVKLTIKDNLLLISAQSDYGEASDEIDIVFTSSDGDTELEIGFNAEFILDVLKSASSDDPIFYFKESRYPAYIEGGEGELYIVMPVIVSR